MTRPEPSNASRSQKYWSQTTFMITQRKSSLILNLVSKSRSSTLFWKFIRQVSSTKAHSLLKKLENYKKFPQTEREKNTQYTIPLAKQTQVAISLPSNSFPTGRRPLPRVVQVVAISANHPSWPRNSYISSPESFKVSSKNSTWDTIYYYAAGTNICLPPFPSYRP